MLPFLALALFMPTDSVPSSPSKTIDQLMSQLVSVRSKKADAEKQRLAFEQQEKELIAKLLSEREKLLKQLQEAGIAPPAPTPPPMPLDQFKVDLMNLFNTDKSPNRKNQAVLIASIYRLAAKEADNRANATLTDLLSLISDAINNANGLDANSLSGVRGRVKTELETLDSNGFTADVRARIAAVYTRAAEALENAAK